MLETSGALRAANGPHAQFSVPGLVAASIWVLGLLAGVGALATGHALVAIVALTLAVAAPWFGLAWVSRSQPRADGRPAIAGPALRPGRPSAW